MSYQYNKNNTNPKKSTEWDNSPQAIRDRAAKSARNGIEYTISIVRELGITPEERSDVEIYKALLNLKERAILAKINEVVADPYAQFDTVSPVVSTPVVAAAPVVEVVPEAPVASPVSNEVV